MSSIDKRLKDLLAWRNAEYAAGLIKPRRYRGVAAKPKRPRRARRWPRKMLVAPFEIGPRVRVNENLPHSCGLEGTLLSVPPGPQSTWLLVRLDGDDIERPVRWHREFFDWAEPERQL